MRKTKYDSYGVCQEYNADKRGRTCSAFGKYREYVNHCGLRSYCFKGNSLHQSHPTMLN